MAPITHALLSSPLRPILLLHGGGQTRHAWSKTAAALARSGYFAIAADLKGHGDSYWDPRARERREREQREGGGKSRARYEFGQRSSNGSSSSSSSNGDGDAGSSGDEGEPYSLENFAADADRVVSALSLMHPARMKRGEGELCTLRPLPLPLLWCRLLM